MAHLSESMKPWLAFAVGASVLSGASAHVPCGAEVGVTCSGLR